MQYSKKARGTITAEAEASLPSSAGSHRIHIEAILRDASGDEVARARARWKLDLP